MEKFNKRFLVPFFSPWLGKAQYQKFFELLHMLSLLGMNVGGGTDVKDSGEIIAFRYVLKKTHNLEPLVIFDVGAHVGGYTNCLLKLLKNREAQIHSFEPSKTSFNKLESNINYKSVHLHNFGFGDENKKLTLFRDSNESVLASIYKRRLDHFSMNMSLKEQILIKTIDAFCSENRIKHIHFLKLDVEGNEFNALKGANNMIKNNKIDFIQFEFGGCNIDSRTYFQDFYYLLNQKYKIYRILKNGLHQISQYKETQEIFITTNYLAERIK